VALLYSIAPIGRMTFAEYCIKSIMTAGDVVVPDRVMVFTVKQLFKNLLVTFQRIYYRTIRNMSMNIYMYTLYAYILYYTAWSIYLNIHMVVSVPY
jgi:hypothetical protein